MVHDRNAVEGNTERSTRPGFDGRVKGPQVACCNDQTTILSFSEVNARYRAVVFENFSSSLLLSRRDRIDQNVAGRITSIHRLEIVVLLSRPVLRIGNPIKMVFDFDVTMSRLVVVAREIKREELRVNTGTDDLTVGGCEADDIGRIKAGSWISPGCEWRWRQWLDFVVSDSQPVCSRRGQ